MKLIQGITLLLCLLSNVLAAQPKPLPDSIRIEFPDQRALITVELRQYFKDKDIIRRFPSQLESMLAQINKGLTATDRSTPHHIDVVFDQDDDTPDKYEISIREAKTTATAITVQQNTVTELIPPGWTMRIRWERAEINVYAPDYNTLSELTRVNLENVLTSVDGHPDNRKEIRYGITSRVIVTGTQAQLVSFDHRLPYDMLGLHPGAGVGVVRDQFYPEANFMLSLYLANRYRENFQRISFHYDLKLFTGRLENGSYRSMPASFLSVSYALNFRQQSSRWTSVGIGLMPHNRSDIFTGKTMRLFLESDIGSPKLNIIPELFLTDDFKQSIFGIKLNYKF